MMTLTTTTFKFNMVCIRAECSIKKLNGMSEKNGFPTINCYSTCESPTWQGFLYEEGCWDSLSRPHQWIKMVCALYKLLKSFFVSSYNFWMIFHWLIKRVHNFKVRLENSYRIGNGERKLINLVRIKPFLQE